MPGIQASCSMFYALTLHKEEEEEKAKRVYVWECVSIGGGRKGWLLSSGGRRD